MAKNIKAKKADFLKNILKKAKKANVGGKEEGKAHEATETKAEEAAEPAGDMGKKYPNLKKK